MSLKRKRSDAEISTSSSLLYTFPLPRSIAQCSSITSPQASTFTRSLFSSRSRKRHRDNRPGEEEVYRHTLDLLFSAQKRGTTETQIQPQVDEMEMVEQPSETIPGPSLQNQPSLHSFWPPVGSENGRDMSPSTSSTVSRTSQTTPSAHRVLPPTFFRSEEMLCEDCEAPLQVVADDAMDVDFGMGNGFNGCGGKRICGGCVSRRELAGYDGEDGARCGDWMGG